MYMWSEREMDSVRGVGETEVVALVWLITFENLDRVD